MYFNIINYMLIHALFIIILFTMDVFMCIVATDELSMQSAFVLISSSLRNNI